MCGPPGHEKEVTPVSGDDTGRGYKKKAINQREHSKILQECSDKEKPAKEAGREGISKVQENQERVVQWE